MSVNGFDFDGTVHRYNYNSLDNIPPNIAPAYSASSTYAVGDYCTKDNVLYKCSTAISTAEAWNSAHWTQVQLATDVADLRDDLSESVETLEAEIEAIEPGLSAEAKEALLNCFAHVAWIGQDGQDYYDALATALNQDPTIRFVMTNNSSYGPVNSTQGDKYYVPSTVSARARFNPVKNKNNVIAVTDSDKYNLALYEVTSDTLITFEAMRSGELITLEGYYAYNQEASPTWIQAAEVEAPYFACSFKKMSGTDFTTDEIENAEGTIFVYGKSSDIYVWNGTEDATTPQKWIDKNLIIGVNDPSKLALVDGVGINSSYPNSDTTKGAKPVITNGTIGRASSRSQIIVGDFDGKTIGLSSYVLSTGKNISYGLWYGYINNNHAFNGSQFVSPGDNMEFVFGKWNTSSLTLPTDATKIGTRIIMIAFKNNDSNASFTQAELREIPTLIHIS